MLGMEQRIDPPFGNGLILMSKWIHSFSFLSHKDSFPPIFRNAPGSCRLLQHHHSSANDHRTGNVRGEFEQAEVERWDSDDWGRTLGAGRASGAGAGAGAASGRRSVSDRSSSCGARLAVHILAAGWRLGADFLSSAGEITGAVVLRVGRCLVEVVLVESPG